MKSLVFFAGAVYDREVSNASTEFITPVNATERPSLHCYSNIQRDVHIQVYYAKQRLIFAIRGLVLPPWYLSDIAKTSLIS